MTEAANVKVAQGRLGGEVIDGVRRFLGIPYAAPPTGLRRWAAPQPPKSWTDVRPATQFGPDSLQPAFPGPWPSRAAGAGEDCLYLNVWAPPDARSAPVLVVIHGGGFQLGSGAYPEFDGARLAREGVVVVTFNYRLGVLGFAGDSNWLRDQIAALAWVNANIAAFGGAPERVTLIGVSAGGVSVNALNAAPAARGLFRQAISVSGGGDSLFARRPHRALPPTLAQAPPVLAAPFEGGAGEYAVVDGDLVPCFPSESLRAGASNATRLIFAFSDYESLILDDLALPASQIAAVLAVLTPPIEGACPDGHSLYDHVIFRAPALALADLAAAGEIETYVLDYRYVPKRLRGQIRGAPHGAAMYAILGTHDPNYAARGLPDEDIDCAAAASLRRRLIAFVHGEPPNSSGGIVWPAHAAGRPDALVIEAQGEEGVAAPASLRDLASRAVASPSA